MTRRAIITIDEDTCTGCGDCTTACAEGALKIVNGKAKLVKEQFCDGFGDCIKGCPTGALKIEYRDAPEFDVEATKKHLLREQGETAVRRMVEAQQKHEQKPTPPAAAHAHSHGGGGCPGSRMRFAPAGGPAASAPAAPGGDGQAIRSELQQWPVQIHLISPEAPCFKGRELAVLSTCSPVASADIHWRFIRGRAVAIGCPKLDDTEGYAEKLGEILSEPTIPKVTVVRMEVPCCGGLTAIVQKALQLSGRKDLQAEEVTVGLNGDIRGRRTIG